MSSKYCKRHQILIQQEAEKIFAVFIILNNFYLINYLDILRFWLSNWKPLWSFFWRPMAGSKMTGWGVGPPCPAMFTLYSSILSHYVYTHYIVELVRENPVHAEWFQRSITSWPKTCEIPKEQLPLVFTCIHFLSHWIS